MDTGINYEKADKLKQDAISAKDVVSQSFDNDLAIACELVKANYEGAVAAGIIDTLEKCSDNVITTLNSLTEKLKSGLESAYDAYQKTQNSLDNVVVTYEENSGK